MVWLWLREIGKGGLYTGWINMMTNGVNVIMRCGLVLVCGLVSVCRLVLLVCGLVLVCGLPMVN